MPVDTAIIFLMSLFVGTIWIYAGVQLVADRDAGLANAAFTALIARCSR